MQVPLRLRSVLGPDTSAIDGHKIEGLMGWREDTDLDFKQALDRTPKGRRGLVVDVVAMANARGGLIVVGIREEDTRAVELTPLHPHDQREHRTDVYQGSPVRCHSPTRKPLQPSATSNRSIAHASLAVLHSAALEAGCGRLPSGSIRPVVVLCCCR
jgi:Putative DNA-binding domain